jgi:hypothetical protein
MPFTFSALAIAASGHRASCPSRSSRLISSPTSRNGARAQGSLTPPLPQERTGATTARAEVQLERADPRSMPSRSSTSCRTTMSSDMHDALTNAGFHVAEAANACEAMAILDARLDVMCVVSDVAMTGEMNGLSLAWEMRGAGRPLPSSSRPGRGCRRRLWFQTVLPCSRSHILSASSLVR